MDRGASGRPAGVSRCRATAASAAAGTSRASSAASSDAPLGVEKTDVCVSGRETGVLPGSRAGRGCWCAARAPHSGAAPRWRGRWPRPRLGRRRSASPAAGRNARTRRSRRRRRHRRGCRGPAARGRAAAGPPAAGSPARGLRRRSGTRWRARAAPADACVQGSGSPLATRSCAWTRSTPVTSFGDRMLDLQPCVHLEEEEPCRLAVAVEQELHGAGVDVPGRAGGGHGRFAHAPAERRAQPRDGLSSMVF